MLVHKCPTWGWEKGEEKKMKDFLPADKQFLSTKGVSCVRRVAEIMTNETDFDVEVEGDWFTTEEAVPAAEEEIEDLPEDESSVSKAKEEEEVKEEKKEEEEEDLEDLDDLEDLEKLGQLEIEDTTALPAAEASGVKGGEIVRSRTYDLSITYDKYYKVPRLWLMGYDEDGKPLSPEQVFEDIMAEQARKTVTIDPHPHLSGIPQASIHPCRHAAVMKKLVDNLSDGESAPRPDLYLFIFLKFMSSVMPTIDYDFTMDVEG